VSLLAKKYRKMLTDWQASYIQSLFRLIETQSKATIVTWCVDYAELRLLPIYQAACLGDPRPAEAIRAARSWMAGEIKFPVAKAVILDCHAAAREAGHPTAEAAARAIGQCASTIHAPTHSAGLMFYGALAVAYDSLGIDAPWEALLEAAETECARKEAALRAIAVEDEPNPAKINWKC